MSLTGQRGLSGAMQPEPMNPIRGQTPDGSDGNDYTYADQAIHHVQRIRSEP